MATGEGSLDNGRWRAPYPQHPYVACDFVSHDEHTYINLNFKEINNSLTTYPNQNSIIPSGSF